MRHRGLALSIVLLLVAGGCGDGDGGGDEATASAARALTETHISGRVSTMEVMALSAEVRSGEWDEMAGMLTTFQDASIPLAAWFVLPDGSYYTASSGLTSANLSDRAYFAPAMAGNTVVGQLVVSRSTGRKSMVAVVPVIEGGDVIGALGISVFLSDLTELVSGELLLGPDVVLYAIDGDGAFALHTDGELITEIATGVPDETAPLSATSLLLRWTFWIG